VTYVTDEERPHLGGYIAGGDPLTTCPDLWDWLVDAHGVRSVIDVGCGEGYALQHFRGRGCRVTGVDGIPQEDPAVWCHDFTEGPWDPPGGEFDLAWCCEFVEHIEERHIPNYLPALKAARMVALTHAQPGQPGWHHVNCQSAAYWKGVLAAVGYRYEARLTIEARQKAGPPANHFARSGMVFTRA